MTLGDKLSKLRKENNYTQEQLAEILGVSRQSISKWESDITFPETDKLIRMSQLFHCTTDYLLLEEADASCRMTQEEENNISFLFKRSFRERKSEKTICGMPLWHIGKNARGSVAVGMNARGVIAIAIGDFSVGALAIGKYVAIGDHAQAMIAIGDTVAVGSVYQKSGELIAQNVTVLELTEQEIITIKSLIDTTAPSYLWWAKEVIKLFL